MVYPWYKGFPGDSDGKESACNAGDAVWSLGGEDSLEKEMATHSSIPIWKTPQTEEPGRLQSMGFQRVGHDWATSLFTSGWFSVISATLCCILGCTELYLLPPPIHML